ncbi:hypothetical protein KSZ_17980 [Dictyobacter formicarum]|uniref:Uncharacterized protein n=1 Tax=Dictyobacter formicarum TaxID=2778368 RepID=A0ABQ3VCD6_9CHLR|nr:hypothetical protein KSZ_17980 [Dictyobacter formicarum]
MVRGVCYQKVTGIANNNIMKNTEAKTQQALQMLQRFRGQKVSIDSRHMCSIQSQHP